MIIALHIIITLMFLLTTIPYFKLYNIKINIHNAPKFLLFLLLMCFGEYLYTKNIIPGMITGIFFGSILVSLQFSKFGEDKFNIISKILSFFGMLFFWPQFLTIIIFHTIFAPPLSDVE